MKGKKARKFMELEYKGHYLKIEIWVATKDEIGLVRINGKNKRFQL